MSCCRPIYLLMMLVEIVSNEKAEHILIIHKAKLILCRGVSVELAGSGAS